MTADRDELKKENEKLQAQLKAPKTKKKSRESKASSQLSSRQIEDPPRTWSASTGFWVYHKKGRVRA